MNIQDLVRTLGLGRGAGSSSWISHVISHYFVPSVFLSICFLFS